MPAAASTSVAFPMDPSCGPKALTFGNIHPCWLRDGNHSEARNAARV
jgi:hypothetical protein